MKVLSNHQHDFDWWDARRGKVTGSMVADVLAFLKKGDKKGGDTAARYGYKVKLATEILLGAPVMDGFLSDAMRWGTENEDLAAAAYEIRTGLDVDTTGFLLHDSMDRFGGSPDRLIGGDGLLEIKCPNSTTHVKWMEAGVVPAEHEPQMMSYLSITGRAWCDFVSYDPRFPSRHSIFTKRLLRNDERIAEIEAGVTQFLSEVDEMVARLESLNPEVAKAKLRSELEDSVEAYGMARMQQDIDGWYASKGMEQP